MYPRMKFRRGFSYLVAIAIGISVAMALATIVTLYSYGIVSSALIPQPSRIEFMGSVVATRTSPNSVELCFYVKNLGYSEVFISSISVNGKYELVVDKARVLSGLGKVSNSGGTLEIPPGTLVEICGKVTASIRSGQVIELLMEDVTGNTYYTFKKVSVYESSTNATPNNPQYALNPSNPSSSSQNGSPNYSKAPQSPSQQPQTSPSPQQLLPDIGSATSLTPFTVEGAGSNVVASSVSNMYVTDFFYEYKGPGPNHHIKGYVVGYGPMNYEWWWATAEIKDHRAIVSAPTISLTDADIGKACTVKAWTVYPAPDQPPPKDYDALILVTVFCKVGDSKSLSIKLYKLKIEGHGCKSKIVGTLLLYNVPDSMICSECSKVINAWLTPIATPPPGKHDYDYYVISVNLGDSKGKPVDWLIIALTKNPPPSPPPKGKHEEQYKVLWIKRRGDFKQIIGSECYEVKTFRWEDHLIVACRYVNKYGYNHFAFFELDKNTGDKPKDHPILTTESVAKNVSFEGFLIKYLDKDPRTKDYRETYGLYSLNSIRMYILNPDVLTRPAPPTGVDLNEAFFSRVNPKPPAPPPPPPPGGVAIMKPLSNAVCRGYGTENILAITCFTKVKDSSGNERYVLIVMNPGYSGDAKYYEEHHGCGSGHHGSKCHGCKHGCHSNNFIAEGPYYIVGWLKSSSNPNVISFPLLKDPDGKEGYIVVVSLNGTSIVSNYLVIESIDHKVPNNYELKYEFHVGIDASATSLKVGEELKASVNGVKDLPSVITLWSWGDGTVGVMSSDYEVTHKYLSSGAYEASVLVTESLSTGSPASMNYVDITVSK